MKAVSSQEKKGVPFLQVPWKALLNEVEPPPPCPCTDSNTHAHCSFYTLKIPLRVRFIGVVIGFITPPPPFCGTAICNGWWAPPPSQTWPSKGLGVGEKRKGLEGGWRKARCLRSLLLHLLHHLLMLSIHLFSHCWRSLYMLPHSPLKPAHSATSPLSLFTKKSEWMDCHTL